jgi:hypothetical protein
MSSYFDGKQSFLEPSVNQYGSHMVMTNVMKQTRHKLINIDTKYREDNNLQATQTHINNKGHRSLASCNIQLPQRITDVKSMMVRSAEIPMSLYNISESLGNNCIRISQIESNEVFGVPIILIVPDGYYSAASLIAKINELLGLLEPESIFRTSITFSMNSYKHTRFVSIYTRFKIEFAINSNGEADNTDLKNKLGWILGFRKSTYYFDTNELLSEDAVMIHQNKYIYLAIDEFSKGNQQSFITPLHKSLINKNVIAKIVLNDTVYPYGTILPVNLSNGYLLADRREYNGKIDIQKLLVQLIDANGQIVDLNGADFSVTLDLEYE